MNQRKLLAVLAVFQLCLFEAHGISATWAGTAVNGDWRDVQNWTPSTVPNGPSDTASFGLSNVTNIFLSANTQLAGLAFNAGASAYTIDARPNFALTISGSGITNSSGVRQDFVASTNAMGNSGVIDFRQSASAGSGTRFTANGSQVTSPTVSDYGGTILFRETSNAGAAHFTLNGGTFQGANGGFAGFYNNSSAGTGTFIANGASVLDAGGAILEFFNTATASQASLTNQGGSVPNPSTPGITFRESAPFSPDGIIVHTSLGAQIRFHDQTTAGEATLTNNGGTATNASGSILRFFDSSTAAHATITNNGGTGSGANGGGTTFLANSSAGTATIINNGAAVGAYAGGSTVFLTNATAADATLIANGGVTGAAGGTIYFQQNSDGGRARVQVFGNGNLDLSAHNTTSLMIGSIEGTGLVYLGARNLSIGSNNQNTLFSGVMQDGGYPGGPGGVGGSLTKIGSGTLTLSGANTYTGATTIQAGSLVLNGSITSAVTVNGGTLSGSGMARAITVNSGGTLSPGESPGILNVLGNLTLTLGATYLVDLNGTAVGTQYDQTNVTGAISLGGATLSLSLGFTPAIGDAFTIINNDGSDAVAGTFNGLAEGATFTTGSQTFTISYRSGDGNDVVLTSAVPEPATWLFLSAGGALLVYVRRRARN